ncbi:MAG: hypothetical protein Q8S33_17740 [Myxococcales bacterium]|nr:hypothetical protein [Myxococcales bacterium]
MRTTLLLVVAMAGVSLASPRDVCMAECLKACRLLEADCNRETRIPAATRKKDCAEARKTLEDACPAECSDKPPRYPSK